MIQIKSPAVDITKPFTALDVGFYDADGNRANLSAEDLDEQLKKWKEINVNVNDWTELAKVIEDETILAQHDIRSIEFDTMEYNADGIPIYNTLSCFRIDWIEGIRRLSLIIG